jgi:PAS domain S-box-containing protein
MTGQQMAGHYDPALVVASMVIAMVSAYAALDLAARVTAAVGRARTAWLWGGATAMGTGIWSMHYTGMLAFHLPVVVRYDLVTVAASLLAAILASAVALWVVSRRVMRLPLAAAASVAMGLGVATMHYLGMKAIRLPGSVEYNPAMVALSMGLAIAVAFVAVWRAFSMREESTAGWSWPKTLTAMYMGAAIPTMHYTGMAAATFLYDPPTHSGVHHTVETGITGVLTVVLAVTILAIAIVASLVNRRFSRQTAALLDSERQRAVSQTELVRLASFPEFDPNPVLEADDYGNLTYHNGAAAEHFPGIDYAGPMHPALSRVWDAVTRLQPGSRSQIIEEIEIRDRVYEQRISRSPAGDRVIIFCTDITGRLRAAEALRTQERFLRAIIDANPSLIYLKDSAGRFTLANEAVAALHGTSPGLLLGVLEADFLDRDLANSVFQSDESVRDTHKPHFVDEEPRHDAVTGMQRWYQMVKLPLVTPDDPASRVLTIGTDITARRESQLRLHQDAERLAVTLEIQRAISSPSHDLEDIRRTIVECAKSLTRASGAAVWYVEEDRLVLKTGAGTAEGHVGMITSGAGRLAHLWTTGGEVIQIPDTAVEPAVDQEACRLLQIRSSIGVSIRQGGSIVAILGVTSTKPGSFTEDDVQGLRLLAGLMSAAMTRAAAAAESAETEARFRLLADSVPIMIWTSDHRHRCQYFNRHILDFTGRTLEEELAADWTADLHPDDIGPRVADIGAALTERRAYQIEYRRKRHDGVYRWLLDVAVPRFTPAGEFCGYAGTCRDMTESKEAELALRQAQKLEAIGSLAAGVAHEINTPVQYVSDNVHFLQGALGDLLDVAVKADNLVEGTEAAGLAQTEPLRAALKKADLAYLKEEVPLASDQALDGLRRITDIVRAVRQFSHPGSDDPTPTDLNAEIATTAAVSRNEWRYVADLTTHLDPNLPQVPCLASEMRQVLLNLIVNAAHAIADATAGEAGKRGWIEVASRLDGEWAEITVSDSGTGIPEAIRSRIFDPFFTTKDVGRGTGQGLAIAHTIVVEKHRGSIRFDTVLGKGTKFVVRLPLNPPTADKAYAA